MKSAGSCTVSTVQPMKSACTTVIQAGTGSSVKPSGDTSSAGT